MLRNENAFKSVFKLLLAFSFFLFSDVTVAKSAEPLSKKLWQELSAQDLAEIKDFYSDLPNKSYSFNKARAHSIAEKLRQKNGKDVFGEALQELVLWKKFSMKIDAKSSSFSDISRFVADNPFFPNIEELKKNVERVAIANSVPYQVAQPYFTSIPAESKESKIYLTQSKIDYLSSAKISDSQKEEGRVDVQKSIAEIWVDEDFSIEEEKEFLAKYGAQLTEENHFARIENLLWRGKKEEAKRIFNFLSEDERKLFEAIIELQNSPKYIDKILYGVPRKFRSNECLSYYRVLWYKANDKVDDLMEVMMSLPSSSKFSQKWWGLRRLYGREALKQKNYKLAYKLVSEHGLPKTSTDFWEAQWTAGWIALRFMDEPKVAYVHFQNLYQNVSQPVTLARATYWLAMASEAMGSRNQAIEWYKMSAKYPIFFYGQLAIHKHRSLDSAGAQDDIILPKDPDIAGRDLSKISESHAAQIAYLMAMIGDRGNSEKIFEWLVTTAPTDGQIGVIMKIINEISDRQLDAKISRVAAKRNVFFIRDKFQIVREVMNDEYAPLVHAIIKQESGFAPTAISQVGALGFMQLMPDTAKLVAKEIPIAYDKKKLATDIGYNIRLGSHYIKKLIDRFDGSEMLAIASYNAGPNATQRWINEFYDPRKVDDLDKVVDWIELITYSETRNYVQRIMENLIVYKYLMSRTNYDSLQ